MKRLISAALAGVSAVALLAAASTASAQEVEVAWNVGVTSDYVFRGYTQSDEGPAVFGGVDLTYGDFYAGTWLSTVDFGDGTDAEVDFYGGWRPTLGAVSLDLGLVYYTYIGQPNGEPYNVLEYKAAASVPVGPATVGGAVFWAPEPADSTGADGALYYEVNGAFPVTETISLGGAIGNQSYDTPLGDVDYTTWNLGASWAATDHVWVDARYYDTDVDGVPGADSRFAVTARLSY